MPESPAVKVTPIALPGIRIIWPRLLALRLDLLAVVEGRDLLLLFTLEDAGPKLRHIGSLGYRAGSLSLSPSRAFLLLGNEAGNWFEVRDAKTAAVVTTVSAPDLFAVTFAALDGVDVLLSAARAGRIDVIGLPDGEALAETALNQAKPFVVDDLVPLGDGQDLAIIGHPFLDGFARQVFVTVQDLQQGGAKLTQRLEDGLARPGCYDAGVGPCGWDDVLVHRGAGRRGAPEIVAEKGLTVRRLSTGKVLEQVPCDHAIGVRQGLMGTSLAVAFAADGGVHLLPRKGLVAERTFLAARSVSFDQEAGRVALATPDSQIHIVDVAKT
jgi:hypothetical protein